MSLKREIDYPIHSSANRTVIQLGDLKKQIELLTGVRERIKNGYYNRPDVLATIAIRLSQRLKP
jgi:hypothetical protein